MSQTSYERLRDYLGQLPPQSQALLMRAFERAIERGEDTAVATLVLEQLRKVVRGTNDETPPRTNDPARLLFQPIEPFLVEGNFPARPGQVRRASLLPVWQWLIRDGAPDQAREFDAALAQARETGMTGIVEAAVRKFQCAAAETIGKIAAPMPGGEKQRALSRVGPSDVVEDLLPIGAALQAREALQALSERLPGYLRVFGDPQTTSATASLNVPALQTPQVLPFALSLVMQRLNAPWQIIRLAIKAAASDDEIRVAATPYGIAVTMALHDLSCLAASLRNDIRRGHFANVAEHLKILHDGVRGLRTELDLRNDSAWGRQLAAIRADTSNALQSEIDSVPGRVRRLLRQRADKDISASARVDETEVDETAALIDFVAVCRTYASELAINEVTLRTYSDLQHYVEQSTESLVQSLRIGDGKGRAYRQMQVAAAIRFCDVLFGHDYASLMSRAAENALTGDASLRAPDKIDQICLYNLQLTSSGRQRTVSSMNPAINFVEYENRVVSAAYRNLMVGARVVLVDKTSGEQLPEPVTTISSRVPSGALKISLPDSVRSGDYFMKVLDGHGKFAARSVDFYVD